MQSRSQGGRGIDTALEGSSPPSADDAGLAALRAIAELRHPHLVSMRRASSGPGFDRETDDGLSFAELNETTVGNGALALGIRVRILLDVLSGLATLHRARIDGKPIDFVHGEVAPHNIVIGRDGIGRLVPLVASHWSDPPIPDQASLGYVAPERLLGDVFDQRADIFSIGVLLWEAVAERRLFHNQRMDAIVTQLVGGKVTRPPPPPGAPWAEALADVAMQALSVDPSHRWSHIGVMGAEIETITEGCLASSEDIALLVRRQALREGGSFLPGSASAAFTYVISPSGRPISTSEFSSQSRDSAPPPISESRAAPNASIEPHSGGLVLWHGPNTSRSPGGLGSRDSVRPSSSGAVSSGRRRPSQAAITRQSRIVWTAVGVGLALFGLAIYQLLDREDRSAGPTATLTPGPKPKQPPPIAVIPRPPAPIGPSPMHLAPPTITPPTMTQAAPAGRQMTATNTAPARGTPSLPRIPSPPPRPVGKAVVPMPPATASAPPLPEPTPVPTTPPAPKVKEDDFGI